MHPSRRRILAAVATSVSLAGCLGDDTPGTPAGEPATDSPTPTEPAPTATVQLREQPDLGDVLVGPEGMTLYMFDSDANGAGESTCYDDCAEAWPPLTVDAEPSAGDGVTAALTTFERDDGETQVAGAGWPLYYYAPDEEPGDASGQGVGDVWWVLGPDGTPVRSDGATGTPTPSSTATPTETDDDGYY